MQTFLIGNSLVKDVVDTQWTTICLPGANWQEVIRYVFKHKRRFVQSFIYILIGPVRFSRLHRTQGRRECVLQEFRLSTPISIFRSWLEQLTRDNIVPVLCTVYPANFITYNNIIRKERLMLQNFYKEWNAKIKGMVVVENKLIVNFNAERGIITPFIHRKIFHRNNRTYNFREQYLSDGLHPTTLIVQEWKREISRVNDINLTAWRQRHENR